MLERIVAPILAVIVLLAVHVVVMSTLLGTGHGTPQLVANAPLDLPKPAAACKDEG